ncbi:uncharacterized protein TNCV_3438611 [Trichonephila clavipes]|nr:uncharacterized protein TNCV_3438611 [Trichonephila clavipes]
MCAYDQRIEVITSNFVVLFQELFMNKKQEHSALVYVENWQRHPTMEARLRVFVTFFPSRNYSTVRSRRLNARGTMTMTSYRIRSAVGVRHLFSVEVLPCCPVLSWCTRNDDNDILPLPRGGGCSSPFFRRGCTLLSGRVFVQAER